MINLRYHIVSLVAVFLALGIGVVMGATVIDRVTVDALNNRLDEVRKSVDGMRDENRRLDGQLATVQEFADQARDQIIKGHLQNVPVLVMAVTGVDRKPVDALNQALIGAGASLEGTIWFDRRLRLENDDDRRALGELLGVTTADRDSVRSQALIRIAATVGSDTTGTATPGSSLLTDLLNRQFISYDAPPATKASSTVPAGIQSIPLPNTRVVLVSGAGAEVGDDILAVPFAEALLAANARLLAAESGRDTPGGRSVFVGLLRNDGDLASGLSTVDNLESPMGQAASVLATEDLGVPRTGHFGVGPRAERLLPAPPA